MSLFGLFGKQREQASDYSAIWDRSPELLTPEPPGEPAPLNQEEMESVSTGHFFPGRAPKADPVLPAESPTLLTPGLEKEPSRLNRQQEDDELMNLFRKETAHVSTTNPLVSEVDEVSVWDLLQEASQVLTLLSPRYGE
jgi:hypothetical protein